MHNRYIKKSDEFVKLEVQRKVKIKHMNYIVGHSDNFTIFLVVMITVLLSLQDSMENHHRTVCLLQLL